MRTLYKQNGKTTLPGGVDLIFTMDEEGYITMDQGTYEVESGTSLIAEGNALLYYYCKQYPDACFFDNNNGVITLSTLVAIGEICKVHLHGHLIGTKVIHMLQSNDG